MTAGALGVDPLPLTLRQLLWMIEGHKRDAWMRTAWLCALIANCNRDPKKGRAFTPADFYPGDEAHRDRAIRVDRDGMAAMKRAFTGSAVSPSPKRDKERQV